MKTRTKKFNFYNAWLLSIVIGVLQLAYYLFDTLFISYFSDLGIREWFSPVVLSFILLLNSIYLYKKMEIGLLILKLTLLGFYIDRFLVLILFWDYTNIYEIMFPILTTIPLVFLFRKSDLKLSIRSNHILLISLLAIFILIIPKLYF